MNKAEVLSHMVDLVQKGLMSAGDVVKFEATGQLPTGYVPEPSIEIGQVKPLLVEYGSEKYDVLEICRKVTAMEIAMCEDCRVDYEETLERMEGLRVLAEADLGN